MSKKKQEKNEVEATEEGAVVATEGEEAAPKKGKKKLVFIVAAVLLLLGVGAGLFFSGVLGGSKDGEKHESHEEEAAKAAAAAEAAKPVYYELPQFMVNLNSTTSRVSFIKLSVTLELRDAAAVATIDANAPRIKDAFLTYLRELRASELQGSAAIFRLKTEMMARLNGTIEAGLVKDMLFGEIIVQ